MFRIALLALVALAASALPAAPAMAQGQCSFCDTNPPPKGQGGGRPNNNGNGNQRAQLTVESDIDFGRLVLVGNGIGTVIIDLQTGAKVITGGLDDLGGIPVNGRAVVTGSPFRAIRIDMPLSIIMSDPGGGEAELRDLRTDLPALPMLDANGQLIFKFTGTLATGSAIGGGGVLRGRIPIRVQYD